MPHDLNFHYQDCENLSPHCYHFCKHSCRPLPVISFRVSVVAVLTYSKESNEHYYSSKQAINCITKILWARQTWKHTDTRFWQVVNKEDGGEKVLFCSNQLLRQHSCVLHIGQSLLVIKASLCKPVWSAPIRNILPGTIFSITLPFDLSKLKHELPEQNWWFPANWDWSGLSKSQQ